MRYLPRTSSDHSPMVISLVKNEEKYGPAPFRFQQMWVDHLEFLSCVRNSWQKEIAGSGLLKLQGKLQRLKKELKVRNKAIFGWIGTHIQCLEKIIEDLETTLQNQFLEDVELDLLDSRAKLDTWLRKEEIRLSHCAKDQWWKYGDNNSQFFHALLDKRKQYRVMEMKLANGMFLRSHIKVHDGAIRYFLISWDKLRILPLLI